MQYNKHYYVLKRNGAKKTSVAFTIKLNKATQSDVISKLNDVDNRTKYIVELVRKDLEGK